MLGTGGRWQEALSLSYSSIKCQRQREGEHGKLSSRKRSRAAYECPDCRGKKAKEVETADVSYLLQGFGNWGEEKIKR